ncbi:hypothetical protein [Ramlibacter sp. WS9]|uniref:hypothetical protein n=1 Tax=Ramlibacter sp. WS9 TaxID=1882741 RepID=UPI00114136AA|nr:hypothetical protein [Ramlibacter sp. WS9]ROZ72746.1 hypothetical protein EEB15_18710 [Ramlibacter sp. WS9]
MYLSVYRFEGDTAVLAAAYGRLLASMPTDKFDFHACIERPGGIEIYDACPTREVHEAFVASPEFRGALAQAGLPSPEIVPLGETRAAFAQGRRLA